MPLDSCPRFKSSWAADSSEEEQDAAAAVAVHEAAGGGTGSNGGADHIIVRTPPISPMITVGGGLGGAGVGLCAGGFIVSPEIKYAVFRLQSYSKFLFHQLSKFE